MRYDRFILVGQPNCGKSTIFNSISGYKVKTGNFPGVTVKYTEAKTRVHGDVVTVTDLPGVYSLYPNDDAEKVSLDYIIDTPGTIIDIIDASVLSRSLELTLELMELQRPMIVALNMMDEAKRKGIEIDVVKLEKKLGVPVVPTIAHKGIGITELMAKALDDARTPHITRYPDNHEGLIKKVIPHITHPKENRRFFAIRLLHGDYDLLKAHGVKWDSSLESLITDIVKVDRKKRGDKSLLSDVDSLEMDMSDHRHNMAMRLFEAVAKIGRSKISMLDRVDTLLLHPVFGYISMFLIFLSMLGLAFYVGDYLSALIIDPLDAWREEVTSGGGLTNMLISGFMDGIIGGLGIVLPYMIPMLLFLEFLDDVGYLSRAAFLLDTLFHRLGMHGKAVGPFLLGYGCSVPAILATRIIEDPWERLKAAVLIPMIPCSARSVIILALVAGLFGPIWAIFFYLFNVVVIGILGIILRARLGHDGIGLVMEMPDLKVPSMKIVAHKVYLIVYDFSIVAWPVIIIGSIFLAFLEYYGVSDGMNLALSPLTVFALGLPAALGVTLIFGIFRKELALIMAYSALGISIDNISSIREILTTGQIFVFVTFVTFFIPCFSTLVVLYKEFGMKDTLKISSINFVVALLLAFGVRALFYTISVVGWL